MGVRTYAIDYGSFWEVKSNGPLPLPALLGVGPQNSHMQI